MKIRNMFVGLVAATFSMMAMAQAPIVIKFSHVVAADTPKGKASEFFAKRAGELTKGKVKVEVYANSTLYKDKEEMEALQLGAVQMLAPSLAKFAPLGVKEFELFDLPYLFDDYKELHLVTEGPVGKALLQKLETRGLVGLAYWDNGFKVMSANKPLNNPEDYKGLKMRIQSSNVLDAQMRAVGAIPQKMAFSEVYQALQTGVVDGTENPPSNLYTQNDARGAEACRDHQPRLSRLCRDHQQEVLGRFARGCAHGPGGCDGGVDQVCQLDRQGRQRQGAGRSPQVGQEPDRGADRRAKRWR